MIEVNTNFTDYIQFLKPAVGNKVVMLKFKLKTLMRIMMNYMLVV